MTQYVVLRGLIHVIVNAYANTNCGARQFAEPNVSSDGDGRTSSSPMIVIVTSVPGSASSRTPCDTCAVPAKPGWHGERGSHSFATFALGRPRRGHRSIKYRRHVSKCLQRLVVRHQHYRAVVHHSAHHTTASGTRKRHDARPIQTTSMRHLVAEQIRKRARCEYAATAECIMCRTEPSVGGRALIGQYDPSRDSHEVNGVVRVCDTW